jgi:hypothetical protein
MVLHHLAGSLIGLVCIVDCIIDDEALPFRTAETWRAMRRRFMCPSLGGGA